ncbi:MAG TPA: PfkB family carbohydrate kinase, partial [Beutenbergiaceae bacterium]|nr:PfkB family carbohydrate kinase [Beutenbergiaceae bacterium]
SDIGATEFDGADKVFVPAPRVDVVEVVGAGDAFAAGYIAAFLQGKDPTQRLQAGHERAGLVLQTTSDFMPRTGETSGEF